jgi:putative peptide zinc metalloprotease protein
MGRLKAMDDALQLTDPLWYRVAELTPHLKLHVRIQRRRTRTGAWYVLCDDVRQSYYRLDDSAYQFVGRFDGETTVEAAWRAVHERLGERAPTQAEALRLLQQLGDDEVLWLGGLGNSSEAFKQRRKSDRLRRHAFSNPLAFRVGLFDPSAALDRLAPLARALFSPAAALVWALFVLWGLGVAATHAAGLASGFALNARTSSFLWQAWLFYPLVKFVHEAAHALAVRRWGGQVRSAGLHLVMFTPLPHVDASAANGFAQRGPRMLVAAAGVMAELAIAAAAVIVWQESSALAVRQAALAIVAGCGLSTLLFNANPLARFDGYYVLCDLLEMPNLGARGNSMVAYLCERALGGSRELVAPEASRREAAIVTAYAVLAWLYQLAVVAGVCLAFADDRPRLAAVVGLAGIVLLLKRPVAHVLGYVLLNPALTGRRLRAAGLASAVAAGLAVVLFAVPAPQFTVQQGVVSVPPDAILRADAPGELRRMAVREGERVEAGQLVAVLENLELRSQRAAAAARLQEAELRYFDTLLDDPLEARKAALERTSAQAALARLDGQIAGLSIRARVGGRLVAHADDVQPGRYFEQGREIGYVLPEQPRLRVTVALTEAQAALVHEATRTISLELGRGRQAPLAARIEREVPGAVQVLPNAVLSRANGGPVPTDPADPANQRTLAPVDLVDVVADGVPTTALGATAWVRFDHPARPLGQQWARAFEQMFLARLGPRA